MLQEEGDIQVASQVNPINPVISRMTNAAEHSLNPEFKKQNSCQFPDKSEVVEQQSVLRILGDYKLF